MKTAQYILELSMKAKSLWNERSVQEKRQLLDKILSNLSWDGVNVGYDLKKPFAVLVEMKGNDGWWSQEASLIIKI